MNPFRHKSQEKPKGLQVVDGRVPLSKKDEALFTPSEIARGFQVTSEEIRERRRAKNETERIWNGLKNGWKPTQKKKQKPANPEGGTGSPERE